MKIINKEGLLRDKGVSFDEYNADKVYKMIRNMDIKYDNLNKENVVNMILNNVNSSNRSEGLLCKKKFRKEKPKSLKSKIK